MDISVNLFELEQFNRLLESPLEEEEAKLYLGKLAQLSLLFTGQERELPAHLRYFNPPKEEWERLILFPGSFSPWHLGHQACVGGCGPYPVLIIPDRSPWKEERETSLWEDFKEIYHFVSRSEKANLYLYPGFLIYETSNPTVDWLLRLPLKTKRLLVGDDTFLSLQKWKEAPKLLSALDEIYVCPRQGEMDELSRQFDFLNHHYQLKIFFLEAHDYQHLSSTELRKN